VELPGPSKSELVAGVRKDRHRLLRVADDFLRAGPRVEMHEKQMLGDDRMHPKPRVGFRRRTADRPGEDGVSPLELAGGGERQPKGWGEL
jgi:hypothetical protein